MKKVEFHMGSHCTPTVDHVEVSAAGNSSLLKIKLGGHTGILNDVIRVCCNSRDTCHHSKRLAERLAYSATNTVHSPVTIVHSSVTIMVQIMPVIVADNKPVNMPSSEEIFKQVHVARRARSKSNHLSGVPLFDESSGAAPYAWVRYGPTITMGEALTHHFVGQALYGKADAAVRVPCVYIAFESNGWGYIVMEYIDGSTCDDSDAALIATAVESLITVRGPTAVPGHVGGGPIRHYFFTERESPITYDSVKELEDHINGVSVPSSRPVPLAPSLVPDDNS